MRIYFERNGGFLGRPVTYTVDTSTLPTDEADSLQNLVKAATVLDLPKTTTNDQTLSKGRDEFQYKVVFDDDRVKYTIETTDTTAPDSLRPLLRQLTLMTRSSSRLST